MCYQGGVYRELMAPNRCPDIGRRVLKLCIQPKFLPELSSEGKRSWKKLKARKAKIRSFLNTVLDSLPICPQIRELVVTVHDQYIPKTFSTFLKKLVKQVGPRIHTLTIDMTSASVVSNSHVFPKRIPNLTSLIINIAHSPASFSVRDIQRTCRALAKLITSVTQSLQSLVLKSSGNFNFSDLIPKLPNLPLLKSIELQAEQGLQILSQGTFHLFVRKNANNLERLVIRRNIPVRSFGTNIPFGAWRRRELEMEMELRVIPENATFDLRLRKLSLWGQHGSLTYGGLLVLARQNQLGRELEHLQLSVGLFSPDHLDLFSDRVPNLKTLVIRYETLGASRDSTEVFGLWWCIPGRS